MMHVCRRCVLAALSALLLAGCASVPDMQSIRQALGLEPAFAHYDVPAPPTPAGYIVAMGMSQVEAIDYREPRAGVQGRITDPQVIRRVLDTLRAAPYAAATPEVAPAHTITLDFSLGRPSRTVIATYDPTRHLLMLYNVPTPDWPEHMVATYAVAPGFGAELNAALQTSPQP